MNAAILETLSRTAGAAAQQALAALGDAVLLIDPVEAWMPWCTPAAAALLAPLGPGAPLQALCERLAGLGLLVASRGPARGLVHAGGRAFEATIAPAAGGRLALRLADAGAQGQAVQRHLEDRERLLFTSRVVSVGEMASTLAHELNQPIGAVVNLLRGVQMRLARPDAGTATGTATGTGMAAEDDVRQALARATEQALFAARIITRIREYTHSRSPKRARFDLGQVLRASVQLLDWEIARDAVRLELTVPPDAQPVVVGDEVMLQQVFVNLARNALDAMRALPAGAPRVLGAHVALTASQVEVAITDTGCGLSDEAEERLFVPFVSTKPSGMGIGLNICRSFVELHQGRLWFSRREPAGCAFHVALPLAATRTQGDPAP
jgi:signal transduction histidine kinase